MTSPESDIVAVTFAAPPETAGAFLHRCLRAMGVLGDDDAEAARIGHYALRGALLRSLTSLASVQMQAVITIPSAQNLGGEVLDEIRFVCERVTDIGPVVKFVLEGDRSLDARLRERNLQYFVIGAPADPAISTAFLPCIDVQRPEEESTVSLPERSRRRLFAVIPALAVLMAVAWFAWPSRSPVPPHGATTGGGSDRPAATPPAPSSAPTPSSAPAVTGAARPAASAPGPAAPVDDMLAPPPAEPRPARPPSAPVGSAEAASSQAKALAQRQDVKGLLHLRDVVVTSPLTATFNEKQRAAVVAEIDADLEAARKRQLEIDRRRLVAETP